MTTREKLEKYLTERGFFDNDAKSVVDIAIPQIDALTPNYSISWGRDASEYPEQLFLLWFTHLRWVALKWIDLHKPQAWFREMFTAQEG